MNKYELLYIISSSVAEEQREELIKKINSLVEKDGGVIESVDKWGMKKLAYPIDYRNEGFYVLVNFSGNPSIIKEMNSLMNITEAIVRQMFIKK